MSDSKPFEIRANLLSLAKDVLSENAHMKREAAERLGQHIAPTFTTEEIIAEAEKLYGFVSRK